jgi:thiol:disulfide interchange protein DsbD
MGLKRRAILGLAAWVLFATLPAVSFGQWGEEADLFKPKASFHPPETSTGAQVEVQVRFDLAQGIHLYKDRFSFSFDELQGLDFLRTVFPPSMPLPDPAADGGAPVDVYEGSVTVKAVFLVTALEGEPARVRGRLTYQGCSADLCYVPEELPFSHVWEAVGPGSELESAPIPYDQSTEDSPEEGEFDILHLLLKILQAFGIGFLISLTPCVYPMIGVTAAIIGGSATDGRRRPGRSLLMSLVYVAGISVTYSILGVLTALAGAPFAQLLKSGWVLLPIAGIFVILALGMFDVLSIQTPAFIQNRLTGAGPRSGLGGKFLLGLVSGAVATPCVAAPLIATLLEIATMGARHGTAIAVLYGLAMLFSLAWGMGVVLVAAGVLTANVLPRSGAWMAWIKKLFGFGMLWAAVYFVQPLVGELVYDLLTSLILFTAVVFLGGLDRLDRESTTFDRMKKVLALPALAMAVLLFVGSLQGLTNLFPWLDCGKNQAAEAPEEVFKPADADELNRALASGRAVVVDFWAPWCKVCKELERETFADARVVRALLGVTALRVNYDTSPDLVRRFKILGVPTVIFFDEQGREVPTLRFSGRLPAEDFLTRLEGLHGRAGSK